jgi:hypothetical protein
MILFFNVLVTDARFSQGVKNRADRLDLFKYTLASYACIDRIDRVIIYCQLDGSYADRWKELVEYVEKIFVGRSISMYGHSPANQLEWQEVLTAHADDLLNPESIILYSGNDDHIFIDHDLDVLDEGLDLLIGESADQINTLMCSSWVEAISTVYGLGEFETVGRYWAAPMMYTDAIQIVNGLYFRHLFFDLGMGGAKVRRTDGIICNWFPYLGDYIYPSLVPHPQVKTFVPLRELVRHFDAYTHVNVSVEDCPLLEIPSGFFSGDMAVDNLHRFSPLFWERHSRCFLEAVGVEEKRTRANAYNAAHRRIMIAPHMRDWQNPQLRFPPKPAPKYRNFGNGPLPLEEKYIQAGYRS